MLRIDRTELVALSVVDDPHEYDRSSLQTLLKMLGEANKRDGGIHQVKSAFGIIGFVRFFEGYYMILVTNRRCVALIGAHRIYKVEETAMVSIVHPSLRVPRHHDEARYVRIFQNIDLRSNFYLSYTYDITHTLQYNMLRYARTLAGSATDAAVGPPVVPGSQDRLAACNRLFVWNDYLLKDFAPLVHPEWVLPIIHGFWAQDRAWHSRAGVGGAVLAFKRGTERERGGGGKATAVLTACGREQTFRSLDDRYSLA